MNASIILPGTILEVPKLAGLVRHPVTYVGPIGPNGEDVVNNTPDRGVQLEHHSQAIANRPCKIAAYAPASAEERGKVVSRALRQVGRKWRLFGNNCDDTANYARTGRPASPQLVFWVGLLIVLGILHLAFRRSR